MKNLKQLLFAAAALLSARICADNPAVFRYPDRTITAIQEQSMMMPGSLFRSASEKLPLRKAYPASCNVFLMTLKDGTRCLIDAGFGKGLFRQLRELGIPRESISAVFITHIHPDHVGGLIDADGTAAFSRAKIYISRKEYNAWKKDAARARMAGCLEPYHGRIVLLDYDKEVQPYGLTPLDYSGHTPGHTVYRIGNRNEYFVGDIVHAADLQVPHFSYCARYDMNPRRAVASRKGMLLQRGIWYGAHIPYPGKIGIVREIRKDGKDLFSYSLPKEK